jgi:hypothetical protein
VVLFLLFLKEKRIFFYLEIWGKGEKGKRGKGEMGSDWSRCIPNPNSYSGLHTPETTLDDLIHGIQLMEAQQRAHERKSAERMVHASRIKAKDKGAAINALREAKQYSAIASRVSGQKMVLEQVKTTIETAAISQDIAEVLGRCTVAIKGMTKNMDLTSVDTIMAQLGEQAGDIQEISEAVSTPLDVGDVIDDDSLWEELMNMDELPDLPPPPSPTETVETKRILSRAPAPPTASPTTSTPPLRERNLPRRPRERGAPPYRSTGNSGRGTGMGRGKGRDKNNTYQPLDL